MSEAMTQTAFWKDAWKQHIEAYLKGPPRAALWLAARFALENWKVLEIAGGSCRDARYLAHNNIQAIGSDFSQETLDYLAQRFPDSPLSLQREDAFALSLADQSVDLSFHNGFWICFEKDPDILRLLEEQLRVTRRILVALVHNAENRRLVALFAKKALKDPLYNIRFFHRSQLLELVAASGLKAPKVRLEKFGGPVVDRLLALPGLPGKSMRWLVPRTYRFLPWRWAERIALIVEL